MLVLRVIISYLMCSNVIGQSYQNLTRLKQNLLKNYTKSNRPLRNQNDTLSVDMDVYFHMVEEFNVFEGVLGTHLSFSLNWTDELIRWDSEEYDNITVVNLPHLDVWVPQMVLLNPADNFGFLIKEQDKFLVQYTSEGLASLEFATYLESTCLPNMEYYPFDSHICKLMISHKGYRKGEVILGPSAVYDDKQVGKGQWDVGEIKLFFPEYTGNQYAYLSINLSRQPGVLLSCLIYPIFFQMMINMLVFFLPAECGEKASYAITVFLAVEIFMTIIMDQFPLSSEMSMLNSILIFHLLNTAGLCALTVASLNFYHKSNTTKIPGYLKTLTIVISRIKGDILNDQSLENMSQRTEREDRDNQRRVVVTWQSVSRAVDHYAFYIFYLMTAYQDMLLLVLMLNL